MRRIWWSNCKTMTTSFALWMMNIGRKGAPSRNVGTPPGQQLTRGPKPGSPARILSLRLRKASRVQGCRIGLERSAVAKLGCFPVRRNSSVPTAGCDGSSMTGPAPLDSRLNPLWSPTQLTLGLGEKLGAEAFGAPSAASTQSSPDNIPTQTNIGFAAILRIDLILFRLRPCQATVSPSAPETIRPCDLAIEVNADIRSLRCPRERPLEVPPAHGMRPCYHGLEQGTFQLPMASPLRPPRCWSSRAISK